MKFADNLRKIRKENSLSQEQLAEKIGVSRQAVSKWESGQSYPEMDKVLQICKLFNYNIDELMNENVKEVDEAKQSKMSVNKYIEDFFSYITKTVDVFCSMKFVGKVKCILEQLFICIVLICIIAILGNIGSAVISGIFGVLPSSIYYFLHDILEALYILASCIVSIVVILHIFKVRYLDYYEIVKENIDDTHEDDIKNSEIILQKRQEKIIIRDPEHSESKFLNGTIHVVLLCIKAFCIFISLLCACSFVFLIVAFVLSFAFFKTGVLFVGGVIGIIGALLLNYIVLEILYNFIVGRSFKKLKSGICIIVSLVLGGIGIGLICIGILKFDYTEAEYISDTYTVEMTENLSLNVYQNFDIEYVEANDNDITIIVEHSEFYESYINVDDDICCIWFTEDENMMNVIRQTISDINNKQIKDYSNVNVYVYTSKENIEKLKENKEAKYNMSNDYEEQIEELENTIDELNEKILELEEQLYD